MKKIISTAFCFACIVASPAFAEVDGSVTLQETVMSAVQQHPQVKSLLHNREAVSRNLEAAFGRFFPSVDLYSSYGRQDYSSLSTRANGNDDSGTASDTTLKLTQNIFDGKDRLSTYKAAKDRLTSAENRLLNNVETVGLDAVRAHIDVVRERKLVALAEENITNHQDVLASIAERVEAGAGNKADEMQARGRVARAETTLITYTGDRQRAEADYLRVTGVAPGFLGDPAYTLEQIPATMNEVLDISLANNPKIKVYKAEVGAKEKDKTITDSAYYPNLDLELSTRYTDDLDGDESYLRDERAMLVVSWNLFNGGSDYQQSKGSEARIKEAEADLKDVTDDLSQQVAVAWAEYHAANGQMAKYQEALDYSIQSRDMYLLQFNVGERSLLDVLDALNEVFANNVLLETAQSNYNVALYKFKALEGELLPSLEIAENNYAMVAK